MGAMQNFFTDGACVHHHCGSYCSNETGSQGRTAEGKLAEELVGMRHGSTQHVGGEAEPEGHARAQHRAPFQRPSRLLRHLQGPQSLDFGDSLEFRVGYPERPLLLCLIHPGPLLQLSLIF